MEDLLSQGMLDSRMAGFLSACVLGKLNLMISGGTGTGKTTLLNALAGNIPAGERVVTIEDTPELVLRHPNSVKMISQQASAGLAGVSARELVTNSLRMRPDRIIVGECRTGEAFDMLQAMNTGHQGSMTTIHANTPRDALSRLETLCLLSGSGSELPLIALRKQMKSALDLVIQLKRSRTGKRRIVAISELTGLEGDVITMQDIYLFASESPSGDEGVFKGTGFVPTFVEKLRDQGVELPAGYFA
jgi:pilus assembly protein CpaF